MSFAQVIALSAVVVIIVASSWRIASKAGYPPVFAFLMAISPINLLVLLLFAIREWPIERRLKELR